MRIPDIITLTQKWESEPNVEIQVFMNTDEALKELNLIFKESETFRPIILKTFTKFNPDITEADVKKSKKPFKDFIEAKYGKYCVEEIIDPSHVSFVEFVSAQFDRGMLFYSENKQTILNIKLHRPDIIWNNGAHHIHYRSH